MLAPESRPPARAFCPGGGRPARGVAIRLRASRNRPWPGRRAGLGRAPGRLVQALAGSARCFARAATVGYRNRSTMETSRPSRSLSSTWTRARASECPPRSKKLSCAPTFSIPSVSRQIAATAAPPRRGAARTPSRRPARRGPAARSGPPCRGSSGAERRGRSSSEGTRGSGRERRGRRAARRPSGSARRGTTYPASRLRPRDRPRPPRPRPRRRDGAPAPPPPRRARRGSRAP